MLVKRGKIGLIGEPPGLQTESRLNQLADRFIAGRIRELTGARFEQYAADPQHYDQAARMLKSGRGLRVVGDRVFVKPYA